MTPDEFITSKTMGIRGWTAVAYGDWIIHGSSRDSPDAAKRQAIERAKSMGANGLINFEYYKETGSEAGTGRGTRYFTIYNCTVE